MSQPGQLARLFRASGIYAIGNTLNRLGGFLLLPLYTRYLSVSEYGTLEFVYAVSSIVGGILSVGIASATLRFYFDYEHQRDRDAVISTNFWASLVISAAGSVAIWVALGLLHDQVFPADTPRLAVPLMLAAICLELSTEVCLAYIRAREMPRFFVTMSLAKLLIQCGANIYLVRVADAGIVGVLTGNLLAIAAGWLVLAVYCLKQCGARLEMAKLMPVLRYCAPYLGTTLVGIVAGNFDRFLINGVLSVQALGIYALALKFSRILGDFVGVPFNLAFGAYRYTIMTLPNAGALQARIVRYLACLLALFGLALCYFLIDLLRVMTTPEYWPAADLMPMLALASILGVVAVPLQTGILYKKRTQELLYITVITAACGLPLAWGGAVHFGLHGVCAAMAVTAALTVALTGWYGHRHFPARYEAGKLACLTALWAVFVYLPMALPTLSPLPGMLAKTGLLLLFAALLVLLRVVDVAELKEAVASLRRTRS